MLAFLLITVIKGNERTIGDKLLELDNVKNVHMLYGEFDLVARVEVNDIVNLQNFIIEKIRPIRGIERTDTLITVQ